MPCYGNDAKKSEKISFYPLTSAVRCDTITPTKTDEEDEYPVNNGTESRGRCNRDTNARANGLPRAGAKADIRK